MVTYFSSRWFQLSVSLDFSSPLCADTLKDKVMLSVYAGILSTNGVYVLKSLNVFISHARPAF